MRDTAEIVETGRLTTIPTQDEADYTKWRRRYFGDVSSDNFHAAALSYGKENPL